MTPLRTTHAAAARRLREAGDPYIRAAAALAQDVTDLLRDRLLAV